MADFTREFAAALAIGLEIDCDFFTPYLSSNDHTLRLLRYPEKHGVAEERIVRAGQHTDYGFVTFLFQGDVSGLQVWSLEEQEFAHVSPMKDAIVVYTRLSINL